MSKSGREPHWQVLSQKQQLCPTSNCPQIVLTGGSTEAGNPAMSPFQSYAVANTETCKHDKIYKKNTKYSGGNSAHNCQNSSTFSVTSPTWHLGPVADPIIISCYRNGPHQRHGWYDPSVSAVCLTGATEIAGVDNSARSKLQGWKTQELTTWHEVTRVEKPGVDNAAPDDRGGQRGSGKRGTNYQV